MIREGILLTLVVVLYCQLSFQDTYTAVTKLEVCARVERRLLTTLYRYIDAENAENRIVPVRVTKFVKDLQSHFRRNESSESIATNPLSAFHLIDRFVNGWIPLMKCSTCLDCWMLEISDSVKDFCSSFLAIQEEIGGFPDSNDLNGAANSLIRLFDMYSIDFGKMVDGTIVNVSSQPLSTSQVFHLSQVANALNMFPVSMVLLETIYNKTQTTDLLVRPDDTLADAYTELASLYYKDASEISSLKCFWRDTKIPILRAKEEVLNYDPRISVFYDVISDSETKMVKSLAAGELERSLTVSMDGEDGKFSDNRISQTAWLQDDTHPTIKKLSHRISNIVDMKMESKEYLSDCEHLQILNYGIGGMFSPHVDYLYITESEPGVPYLAGSGERVATWLFYLSDVQAGGSTVFPELKVEVPVTKGGAAFWYNLRRNGELDPRTLHAGCPVLLGSKWVCNKWIRTNSQMFNRPCGLTEDALDGPQS